MPAGRPHNNVLRFKPSQAKHHQHAEVGADHECMNCGTRIQGNYCHACGQAAHVHHSLLHLIEEMVHGLWHFDAKGWRTIPMLIAYPGELTRRYIDGQRVRFIAPLGLYLFMIFLMFFSMSVLNRHEFDLSDAGVNKDAAIARLNTSIADAKAAVDKARLELDQAKKTGTDVEQKAEELANAQEEEKTLETGLAAVQAGTAGKLPNKQDVDKLFELDAGQKSIINDSKVATTIAKTIQTAAANPEFVLYKMKSNAYKFALILVPLSMPFLWLIFFWRKNVTMFDHAVFCLYSLSFMALLLSVVDLAHFLGLTTVANFMMLVLPPVHMFRHLKGTYRLTNRQTWWRTGVLMFAALLLIVLYLLLVGAVSLT